jgi:hypothetical protein
VNGLVREPPGWSKKTGISGVLAMLRCVTFVAAVLGLLLVRTAAQESSSASLPREPVMTSQQLADWIDARFAEEYQRAGVQPADTVDDATFLRRVYLDLQGRIPTVAQLRDFLADDNSFKRQFYVDRLLHEERMPERFAQRSAEHLARVWRRMMIPASAPNVAMATQLDPWLARQFAANTPYNEFARKLLVATPVVPMPGGFGPAPNNENDPDAAAALFQQAVGVAPENLASAYVRVFLGIRLNCAQCHDHPQTDWKRDDFWGIAALLSQPAAAAPAASPAPTIKPATEDVTYTAKLLWNPDPIQQIPANTTARQLLADWLVAPENPNFAATAVNRIWQFLCGRGLAGSVDDLDRVSPQERQVLDDLSKLFI